jgi:hypothetical protein
VKNKILISVFLVELAIFSQVSESHHHNDEGRYTEHDYESDDTHGRYHGHNHNRYSGHTGTTFVGAAALGLLISEQRYICE